jgi:hypothetical protein
MRSTSAIILDRDMTILVISNFIVKHKYYKIVDFTIREHVFGDNIFCKFLIIIMLQIFNKRRHQRLEYQAFTQTKKQLIKRKTDLIDVIKFIHIAIFYKNIGISFFRQQQCTFFLC